MRCFELHGHGRFPFFAPASRRGLGDVGTAKAQPLNDGLVGPGSSEGITNIIACCITGIRRATAEPQLILVIVILYTPTTPSSSPSPAISHVSHMDWLPPYRTATYSKVVRAVVLLL